MLNYQRGLERRFCFTTLCDWLRRLVPPSQPIRCKQKPITNRDVVTHVFARFKLVDYFHFEFSLVPCDIFFVLIGNCGKIEFEFTTFTRNAFLLID